MKRADGWLAGRRRVAALVVKAAILTDGGLAPALSTLARQSLLPARPGQPPAAGRPRTAGSLPGRAGWTAQARRIMRGGGTRTVILVDLDRSKRINDTYGHAAGAGFPVGIR